MKCAEYIAHWTEVDPLEAIDAEQVLVGSLLVLPVHNEVA